ncbi:hypothetical protein EIN_056900 [Entamoeba invadens IP1]|uniref:hypothetical protein n=1 Tax=Entamoeba invadens IP1 TaxID=370355 RepID=UPI0002C3EDD8|nr:hypothetical protein EIN_056900 [Entamoeba invadens IP1]ELP93305.1 hypothetical protein EIN_056900 [Entamoeba invadens IP1]|eukprot:XP_004260076.1 hypothetical protein EIN_056900 [Entamoeba invadens IP1]
MKQAVIQDRLISSTSETIEKTSKKFCDMTSVVADEQAKLWQIVDKANRVQIQQNFYLKSVISDENQSLINCQHKMEDVVTDMAKYKTITSFTTMSYSLNDLFTFINTTIPKQQ